MKQIVMSVLLGLGVVGMTGCAELQQQAGSLLPQQNQSNASVTSTTGTAQQTVADEGSSFLGDMVKEASNTAKSQVSSSIRSTIRGAFSN
ncbi:hypothetical protein [Pseudomonas paracarnis]|uniref:Lipoprotein n=1 Tax=Pseudomonas paracarnis TaxID=2750625 RepID=A0ABU6BZT8_9PSED|nr:hypothetical protein [Pseudomonas paracarnis]MBW9242143.1 hypothetical protein [Pseudomonas paracarnis]MEB3784950.1 hypothetical protein [Pseudomonas paracarnis]